MVSCNRAIGMEAAPTFSSSLPPGSPHHMHAIAPACGDVLQVGASRGLLGPTGSHAPFRLRVGVGVPRARPFPFVYGPGCWRRYGKFA